MLASNLEMICLENPNIYFLRMGFFWKGLVIFLRLTFFASIFFLFSVQGGACIQILHSSEFFIGNNSERLRLSLVYSWDGSFQAPIY